jgi:hypothetical protein
MGASDNQRYWGDLILKLFTIWRGRATASGGLALIGLAALMVGPDYLMYAAGLVGLVAPERAFEGASPTLTAQILACILGLSGAALIVLGIWVEIKSSKTLPAVITLRHESLEGQMRDLQSSDLPAASRGGEIVRLGLDQTAFYRHGQMTNPEAAIQLQADLATRIKTQIRSHPGAIVAYHGKAHIPFAFAAGHAAQADVPALLYELERNSGDWRLVGDNGPGADLGLCVEVQGDPVPGGDAVIRVSISYLVPEADVVEALPGATSDTHIRLAEPVIDAIRTRSQVDAIADRFREVLDRFRSSSRIHVFCAAPMSVVFAIGQRVSPSIHPPVLIHNYTSSASPRYSWAVQVNGGAEPRIIRQTATVA